MSANYNEYRELVREAQRVLKSKSLRIYYKVIWGWPVYILQEIITGKKKPKPYGLKKSSGIIWEDHVYSTKRLPEEVFAEPI